MGHSRFPQRNDFFRTFIQLSILVVLSLTSTLVLANRSRAKTDVVYMRNGDRITCEIRSLEQGQLRVKPDYTDSTIVIDWGKVDRVESSQQFIVSDPKGVQHVGSLTSKGTDRSVVVSNPTVTTVANAPATTMPHQDIIQIEPLGETFFKRMRGDADLGLSLAKSNSQKNLTLQTDLTYQSVKSLFSLDTSSQFTSQIKTNDTNETTVKSALFRQLRQSNWYGGALANFLSSSEQKIDLQSTLGLGIAKRQIFTNRTNLNWIGGLGYSVVRNADNTQSTTRTHALDSAFAVQYSTFRFDSTTFDTTFWVYPSLTSPGHVRFTLNQDVYYKFPHDFYVRLSFYDNYDNEPVVGAPRNNLGGSTTLGWSFR
jgi:Protein of unknown function, DUF481